MAFDDIVFPTEISYGASGGPEFSTTVVVAKSGSESRNQNWSTPRISWDVSTGIQSRDHVNELVAFFRNRKGRARGFLFKDWSDYQATFVQLGTGNASNKIFQLIKIYDDTDFLTIRTILKPTLGTVKVYLDGALQASGWSLNYTTGVLTFSAAPGTGVVVSATFEFYVPVRFNTDKLAITLTGYDSWSSDTIPVLELRGLDAISS